MQSEEIALLFVSPVPIAVPSAPEWIDATLQKAAVGSIAEPLQPAGAASKYLPVEFPAVVGVMKINPPPGPVAPIAQVPPVAHEVAAALYSYVAPDITSPVTSPDTEEIVGVNIA
jgi:hypothetical protein